VTTPNLIALIALFAGVGALGILGGRWLRAGGEEAPPPDPQRPEPEPVKRHRALGTRLFHTDGEGVDAAADMEALVEAIDAFTDGAMALRSVRCEDTAAERLLWLQLPAGWLRRTVQAGGWVDTAALLPLLNGALAHAGAERRLAVATGHDDASLSLAYVTRDEAEALAGEELITVDGLSAADPAELFAPPPPLGGPLAHLPGEPYTPVKLAADGSVVAAVRRGVARVWDGATLTRLQGAHAKADAVAVDAGEVLLAAAEARTYGVWPVGAEQPARTVAVDVDMGRLVSVHRRAGRVAVAVRSRKANQCWVVVLDDAGGESARWTLPYGAITVRWSPDARRLAVALEAEGLKVFTPDGTEVGSHQEAGVPFGLAWRPDGEEVACAFDTSARTVRWSTDAVAVDAHGVSALAYGPEGMARSFLGEVVLPDGRSLRVGRPVVELAWGEALWGAGDHGWLIEVAPA